MPCPSSWAPRSNGLPPFTSSTPTAEPACTSYIALSAYRLEDDPDENPVKQAGEALFLLFPAEELLGLQSVLGLFAYTHSWSFTWSRGFTYELHEEEPKIHYGTQLRRLSQSQTPTAPAFFPSPRDV